MISRCLLQQTPAVYTISPSLFPRPAYWEPHVQVSGYFERKQASQWLPDKDLLDFIGTHEKFLFLSFGSMRNTRPQAITHAFVQVLEKLNIPAIVNTSWGGLEVPRAPGKQLYFVNNIPYSWILPKTYAVVHHGGAGTTHAAIKSGCSSLIIPHIVDQFFWNLRIAQLQLGPLGIPIKKVTAKRLKPLIQDLWTNTSYKLRARTMSTSMKEETDTQRLLTMLKLPKLEPSV